MRHILDYLYIGGTILFTVYGQLIIKWQIAHAGALPHEFMGKIGFLLKLFLNTWIISGIVVTFIGGLCWMAAMTKFELSYAYPFMSLTFVLVLGLSAIFFHEVLTTPRILGMVFIVAGVIIGSQG